MKKLLVLLTFVLLLFAFAIPTAAETPSTEGILVYDGLGARIREDFPGIRSIYTADHAKIDALVAEGYKVEYGAVMGVSSLDGSTERYSSREMTVTYTKGEGYTAQNANAAAVCVYSSDANVTYDTEKYVKTVGDSYTFAYTTTFKAESESKQAYLFGFAYVGFVSVTAPGEETPTITYVYAEGDTFGQENAAYGKTTSLYEISDYFCNEYDKDASVKESCRASQSVRRVLRLCSNDAFSVTYTEGKALNNTATTVTAENMRGGIYAVYMARTFTSGQNEVKIKVNGDREFSDYVIGLSTPNGASDPRLAATAIANDGETYTHVMFVVLDEGDNTLSLTFNGSNFTLYGMELRFAMDFREETDTVRYNKVLLKSGSLSTETLSVKESGVYDIYAVSCSVVQATVGVSVTTSSGVATSYDIYSHAANGWNNYREGNLNNEKNNVYFSSNGMSYHYAKIASSVLLEAGDNALTLSQSGANNTGFNYSALIAVRKTCTVSFVGIDGSLISRQEVPFGEDAVTPTIDIGGDYTTIGWEDAYKNVIDDTTVRGIYRANTDRFSFTPGGENISSDVSVTDGSYVLPKNKTITLTIPYGAAGVYAVRFTGTTPSTTPKVRLNVNNTSIENSPWASVRYKTSTDYTVDAELDTAVDAWCYVILKDGYNEVVIKNVTDGSGGGTFTVSKIELRRETDLADTVVSVVKASDFKNDYFSDNEVTATASGGIYRHALSNYGGYFFRSGYYADYEVTVAESGMYAVSAIGSVDKNMVMTVSEIDENGTVTEIGKKTYTKRYGSDSGEATSYISVIGEENAVLLTKGTHTLRFKGTAQNGCVAGYIFYKVGDLPSFTVSFFDEDGALLKEETVPYGEAANPPAVSGNVSWDADFSSVTSDMTVTAVVKNRTGFDASVSNSRVAANGTFGEDANGEYYDMVSGSTINLSLPHMTEGLYKVSLLMTDTLETGGSEYWITTQNLTAKGTPCYGGRMKASVPAQYDGSYTDIATAYIDGPYNEIKITAKGKFRVYAVRLALVTDTGSENDIIVSLNGEEAFDKGSVTMNCGWYCPVSPFYVQYLREGTTLDVGVTVPETGTYCFSAAGAMTSGARCEVYDVVGDSEVPLATLTTSVDISHSSGTSTAFVEPTGNTLTLTAGTHTLRFRMAKGNMSLLTLAFAFESAVSIYSVNVLFDKDGDGTEEVCKTMEVLEGSYVSTPMTEEELSLTLGSYERLCWDNIDTPVTSDRDVRGYVYSLPVLTENVKTEGTNRDEDELRVVFIADTHYYWPYDEYRSWSNDALKAGGFTTVEKANIVIDALIKEYETNESFDLVIMNGDLANNDPDFNRDQTINTIAELDRLYYTRLTEAGIPYFAVYGGHDYVSDEVWKEIFGIDKNYIVTIADTAFVCVSTFEDGEENYQLQKDVDPLFYEMAMKYLDETESVKHVYVVAHYLSNNSRFRSLVAHEKVGAVVCAHQHLTTASGSFSNKPVLHCGHFDRGEAHNQVYQGNGLKNYVPVSSEWAVVTAAANGTPYYNLQNIVLGTTYLTDENGARAVAPIDENGRYLTLTVGEETYYLYGLSNKKQYVYKCLTDDKFYAVDSDGTLVSVTSFTFAYSGNTPYFLLENTVAEEEFATYDGETLSAIYDGEGVAKELLLVRDKMLSFVLYGKVKTFYEITLTPTDEVYEYNNGQNYDATFAEVDGINAPVYRLDGTYYFFTLDKNGNLVYLEDYYISDEADENGLYTFTKVRMATDGTTTYSDRLANNIHYLYFLDKNGNKVVAVKDQNGDYVNFTASGEEIVYRYVVYGVIENRDGSYTFVYKNNESMDFYIVNEEGALQKLASFDHVTTPVFDRPTANGTLDYSVTGSPFSYRVLECVKTDSEVYVESYMVFAEVDYRKSTAQGATYNAFTQTYLRNRPSDMSGLEDRTYIRFDSDEE